MKRDATAVVIGENTFPFHRIEDKADAFREILDQDGAVEITTDRDRLGQLDDKTVLVDFLTNSTLTTAQQTGLLSFVDGGGGYVGVHCAADLKTIDFQDGEVLSRPDPIPELRELIGGHFLGHPEQSEFGVIVETDHPVTAGVEDFTVYDEPYTVEWDDDVTVLARMDHPSLEDYPVVWTKSYGEGRVCYLSLGHTDEAFATEAFRTLLRNAVVWAGD